LIVVLAVALVYDPALNPRSSRRRRAEQAGGDAGWHALLPLAGAGAAGYLGFIPSTSESHSKTGTCCHLQCHAVRSDGLAGGATPVSDAELSERIQTCCAAASSHWRRWRCWSASTPGRHRLPPPLTGRLPPLTFIGWNLVNIGIWPAADRAMAAAGRAGCRLCTRLRQRHIPYVIWALVALLALPGCSAAIRAKSPNCLSASSRSSTTNLSDPAECYSAHHLSLGGSMEKRGSTTSNPSTRRAIGERRGVRRLQRCAPARMACPSPRMRGRRHQPWRGPSPIFRGSG